MEILSSGSFINLENQEKIERLGFTARELANAAIATEDFVNTEESGKRLALEFWVGLEYICRETEEAAIKNIFFGHFLDRLREFRPAQEATAAELPENVSQSDSVPIDNETKPEDEFLGVMDSSADEETLTEETAAAEEENFAETENISTLENVSVQEEEVKAAESVSIESDEYPPSPAGEIEDKVEPSPEHPAHAKASVGNLSLPEKEPYSFGKCTVTATIQLLPIGDDGAISRKAVLSVRTHDFAPQISLVELAGNNLTAELMPELEKALAKYQSDLPAKVMDKLKREKTTAKKTAPKTTSEAKTVSGGASKPKESIKPQTEPPGANQADPPVVAVSSVQTGQQGSLFGF